ncbi:hypothetical protein HZS_5418 [Henneguya salminicola]|nr:hypothetical protein HZS_5418 [Henneguya salminicola]
MGCFCFMVTSAECIHRIKREPILKFLNVSWEEKNSISKFSIYIRHMRIRGYLDYTVASFVHIRSNASMFLCDIEFARRIEHIYNYKH